MPEHHNITPARRVAGIAILAAIAGGSIYSAWAYRGPYRWVAELQLRYIGSYEEQITFIVSLALIAAPFGLAFWLYRRFSAARSLAPTSTPTPISAPTPAAANAIQLMIARYGLAATLIIVGLFFTTLGAKDYWSGTRAGALQDVPVSDFEHGQLPSNPWIALRGQTLLNKSQGAGDSTSSMTYYIPVVSPDWHAGLPIAAFIKVPNSEMTEDLKNSYIHRHTGMFSPGGLPGMVRVAFERDGVPPADNYILLNYNDTPAHSLKTGRDMLLFSAVLILVGAAFATFARFQSRWRRSNAPKTPAKSYEVKSILPTTAASAVPADIRDQRS